MPERLARLGDGRGDVVTIAVLALIAIGPALTASPDGRRRRRSRRGVFAVLLVYDEGKALF